MPIHDWTVAPFGVVHDFNIAWTVEMQKALNGGVLPDEFYAMVEHAHETQTPGLAITEEAPDESEALEARRRHIVVRSAADQPLAVVEILSSMLKRDPEAVDNFATHAAQSLHSGVALLVVDLFPPGAFDPEGIHGRLWGSLGGHHVQPDGKPLTLASYAAGGSDALTECYVEPTAVGQPLFPMPLFLSTARYVNVPLEETCLAAYAGMPTRWKRVIEDGPRR